MQEARHSSRAEAGKARGGQAAPPEVEHIFPFDDGVLLLADDERLFVCNASAYQIWSRLREGWDRDALAAAIAQAHGIDPRIVRHDIEGIATRWEAEAERARSNRERIDAIQLPIGEPPGFAARWTCRIRGRLFEFAVEDERLAGALKSLLGHLEVESQPGELLIEVMQAGEHKSLIFVDGVERARVSDGIGLRDTVHAVLVRSIWPERPVLAMVHGGAVAWEGKGLCLPAFAGSGKTTLIAHLVGKGFSYLADDMSPVDESGALLPWPMPLSVKKDSWPVLAGLYPSLPSAPRIATAKGPAALMTPPAGAWDSPPTPISALIFPQFSREGEDGLVELRPFQALERLIAAGLWLGYPIVEDRVRILLAWLDQVPAFALTYRDLEQAEGAVRTIARNV